MEAVIFAEAAINTRIARASAENRASILQVKCRRMVISSIKLLAALYCDSRPIEETAADAKFNVIFPRDDMAG